MGVLDEVGDVDSGIAQRLPGDAAVLDPGHGRLPVRRIERLGAGVVRCAARQLQGRGPICAVEGAGEDLHRAGDHTGRGNRLRPSQRRANVAGG